MDLDFFKLAGQSVEMQPAITKWGFEDLGDDPAKHRWRAWWVKYDGSVCGIALCAYPVVKVNRASVWIDEWGNREATKQPWEDGAPAREWIAYEGKPVKKRLLYNDSRQAWAKPTQEEALRSLAIRLTRWTSRLHNEQQRAESAIRALEKLRPDWCWYAKTARDNLKGARA